MACKDVGLTISLSKTNVLAPPVITIDYYELDAVHQVSYLSSIITDKPFLETYTGKRIVKAATTLARLTTVKTKMVVYNTCVISTLLYGSDTWTTYASQERRLNTFHLRSIRRILGISWTDSVQRRDALSC